VTAAAMCCDAWLPGELPRPRASEPQRLTAAERGEARVSAALARVGQELMRSLAKPELFERLCRVAVETLAGDASSTLLR